MHPDPRPGLGKRDGFVLQFALISVLFTVFADWAWALQTAGPIFVWTWVLGGILQLGVALSLAELAGAYPYSGYRWLRLWCPPPVAWFIGYLLLVGYLAAIADSEYRLAGFLLPFAGISHSSHQERVALALLCLVLQSPWSLQGIHWVIRHITVAVSVQLMGIGCLVGGLMVIGPRHSPAFLFSTTATGEHEHMPRILITLLVPLSGLTAFDAPASFAPFFRNRRHLVPWITVAATASAFLTGTLLLTVPLLVLGALPPFPSSLLSVVQERLGSGAELVSEVMIVTSLWFRAVVLQLVAARLLESQAVPGTVPRWRRRAGRTEQGLSLPVVIACLAVPAMACVALPDASALTFVWPAVWALAYAMILTSRMWGMQPGMLPRERRWARRHGSMTVRIVAVGWSIAMAVLIPVLDVAQAVPLMGVIVLLGGILAVRWGKAERGST